MKFMEQVLQCVTLGLWLITLVSWSTRTELQCGTFHFECMYRFPST